MSGFRKWLTPAIAILVILTVILGGLPGCTPDTAQPPLGQIVHPPGNPFAHRFSDVHDYRTATFVVAASDSEHRFEADYTCGATDAEVEINAAIIAANAAGGGTVQLLDGTFNTATDILPLSNVSLLGQDNESTVINLDNSDIYIYNQSNVELGNFKITGDCGNAAVYFANDTADMDNIYIHDITSTATGGGTAHFYGYINPTYTISQVIIKNCKSYNADGWGFLINGANSTTCYYKKVWIDNCYAYRSGYAATRTSDFAIGFGICEVGVYEDILVSDCTAEECWESGFHTETGPLKKSVALTNCTSLNNGQKGAPAFGAGFALGNGNITASNLISVGNYRGFYIVDDNAASGADSVISLTNCQARENTQNDWEIAAQANGSRVITRNCSSREAGRYGLYVYGSSRCDIEMDISFPTGQGGVGVILGSAAHPASNSRFNLRIEASLAIPLNITYLSDSEITGYVKNDSDNAVWLTSECSNLTFHDFDCYGQTVIGLYISGANTANIIIDGGISEGSTDVGVQSADCDNLTVINRRFVGATTPVSISNANVVDARVENCNWKGATNNPIYANATTPYFANNFDKDGLFQPPPLTISFVDGSDPQDSGYEIDLGGEYARTYFTLPSTWAPVSRIKIWARSVVADAEEMHLETVVNGGADNEAYNTHTDTQANLDSTSTNFAADDIIYWIIDSASINALKGGDSVEVKVLHEAAVAPDCATDAFFRAITVEFF